MQRLPCFRTYFGDASRPELLASAGIDRTRLLVVAIDGRQRAVGHGGACAQAAPEAASLWHVGNGQHINIVREAFDSSLRAGKGAMEALGIPPDTAQQITELFFDRDREGVKIMAQVHDLKEKAYQSFDNEFSDVPCLLPVHLAVRAYRCLRQTDCLLLIKGRTVAELVLRGIMGFRQLAH